MLVIPGDLVVGDAEGVVVVPTELQAQVADISRASEAVDAFSVELMLQGVPMDDAYPLSPARKAEFDARQPVQADARQLGERKARGTSSAHGPHR